MNGLVPIGALAAALGVSRQAIEKACQRALRGETWRGTKLRVETVKGRGGNAGVQYQVRADSLPIDLQERLKASPKALPVAKDGRSARIAIRLSIVQRVLAHPKNSVTRANEIAEICKAPILDPDTGRFARPAPDTVRRWVREYEERGVAGVTRKKRADSRRKRTVMTVRFDAWAREAGLPDLEAVAEEVKSHIRGWHKALESQAAIRLHAIHHLEKLTRARGLEPPPGVCDIPLSLVKAERHFRRVGEYKKDRKAFEDKSPAICRKIDDLSPMDVVVGDVHPLDFYLPEIEGHQRYAKAICWLDVATKRLWVTVVFLPIGRNIRNEHVISSLREMIMAFGLPKTLLLDNGSEYYSADFLADAMHLNMKVELEEASDDDYKPVRRARPYAARSKAIEGVFAQLRHVFAKADGYIGGDRMKSKVANVGKAPVPFNGTFDQFRALINAIVTQYHMTRQSKDAQLAGLSPIEAYNRAVEAGWEKTEIDPDAFATVFSVKKVVAIKNGSITINRRRFYFDGLATYLKGDYVTVRVPKYENWDRLPVFDMQDNLLGFAEEDHAYRYFDPAGAKESSRRRALQRRAVNELDKSAEDIDVTAEIIELAERAPKALPAPVGARVTASDQEKIVARGLKESPKAKREREEAERRRQNEDLRALAKEWREGNEARKAKA